MGRERWGGQKSCWEGGLKKVVTQSHKLFGEKERKRKRKNEMTQKVQFKLLSATKKTVLECPTLFFGFSLSFRPVLTMGDLFRCIVALAFLACLSTAQTCAGRHPVVLVPGILGTVLHAFVSFSHSRTSHMIGRLEIKTHFFLALDHSSLDLPTRENLPDECPHHFTDQPIWIDVGQTINYVCGPITANPIINAGA